MKILCEEYGPNSQIFALNELKNKIICILNKNLVCKKLLENEIHELKYKLQKTQMENQKLRTEIKSLKKHDFRKNVAIKLKRDNKIRKEKSIKFSTSLKKTQNIIGKQKILSSEAFHTERKIPHNDISSTETKKNFLNHNSLYFQKELIFEENFHSDNIYYIRKGENNDLKVIEVKPFDLPKEEINLQKNKGEEEIENNLKKGFLKKLKLIQKKPKKVFFLRLKKTRKTN